VKYRIFLSNGVVDNCIDYYIHHDMSLMAELQPLEMRSGRGVFPGDDGL
jgi:hypothetical protein